MYLLCKVRRKVDATAIEEISRSVGPVGGVNSLGRAVNDPGWKEDNDDE